MFSSISLSEFSLEFSLISYGTDAWSIRKVHKLMCHMLNLAAVSLTDETKHCVVFEHLERWFCPESDHELYFTDKIIVSLKKKKVNLNVILRKQCWSSKGNNFNFDFFLGGEGGGKHLWKEGLWRCVLLQFSNQILHLKKFSVAFWEASLQVWASSQIKTELASQL